MPAESLEDRIKELERKIKNIEDEKLEDIEKSVRSLDEKIDREIEEIDTGNQEEFKIVWKNVDNNIKKLQNAEEKVNFLIALIDEKLHPGEVDNFTRHLENYRGFPRDEDEYEPESPDEDDWEDDDDDEEDDDDDEDDDED